MDFNINSSVIFLLAGIVIAAVFAQSIYFLVKALKQAKKIGMDKKIVRRTIKTSAVFTIAPAVAIVISVIVLSQSLGLPLPWLRLSVVGSMTYETVAAQNTLNSMGLKLGEVAALNASQYVTIALVMTISISVGIWLVAVIGKKMQSGMMKMEKRDKKWGEIFNNAMFIGMISAFLGYVFSDVMNLTKGDLTGIIPVLVMIVSALIMLVCGLLVKALKWNWMQDYALPISLVGGMAAAIPITSLLS